MASPPMVALRWANKPQPGPFLDRPKYILDGDLPPNGNPAPHKASASHTAPACILPEKEAGKDPEPFKTRQGLAGRTSRAGSLFVSIDFFNPCHIKKFYYLKISNKIYL